MTPPGASALHAPTSAFAAARRVIAAVGLISLAVITLASPGATRMYAWPWTLVLAAALLSPVLLVLLRATDATRPLVLPAAPWCIALALAATSVLGSALFSPHRGPSLLWSAPLLSGLALSIAIYDWLHCDPASTSMRRERLWRSFAAFAALTSAASIALWALQARELPFARWADARNPFPLGHSNYTAGIALLSLPVLGVVAAKARGAWRALAAFGGLLAFAMLLTSGSRAGILAFGATAALAIALSPLRAKTKSVVLVASFAALLLLGVAHPRTRAMFLPGDPAEPPNVSNVQRTAMLDAAARMGRDRPWLGWGPGTTPLVYPRYRATLSGGAENVLQLHSLPAQVWAEQGALGLLAAALLVILAACNVRRAPLAAVTLGGYGAFALFDWQLDVPFFAAAIATLCALLASGPLEPRSADRRWFVILPTLGTLAVVALLGHRDPAPALNIRALQLASDAAQTPRAIALLRESLALDPHQEIAHLNLGWLLVVREPAAAERHFRSAAQLVPDKGSVYFGLGLARVNQGQTDGAVRAFALECLNDPAFLLSPWWATPEVAALRAATLTRLAEFHDRVALALPPPSWAARENRYLQTLAAWLTGTGSSEAVAVSATTPGRRAFFSATAAEPARLELAPARSFRRARVGYPVLMRDLDLPVPVDVFDPLDGALRDGENAFMFPAKGWLPSPLLLTLLDAPISAIP